MLLGVSGVLEGYSGHIDEETRDDLILVKDGIERLTRLVQTLLDLSRIEAHKIEFKLTRVAIPGLVERAVEEVSELAAAHHHTIVVKPHDDLPETTADEDRIIQVLVNLLSNSIKYAPDGGKILVELASNANELVISVADNGYGIPAWAQEEVFKKFFQADSVMSQKVGGCGLGLPITKGIVEEHGGSIRCESPLLQEEFVDLPLGGERSGTVFVVRLPIR